MSDREIPATSWAVWAWQAYRDGRLVEADRIEELEKRNASLEAVLRDVDAWVDDLSMYAQEGFEPANVFKRVKEVLSSE